jgi:outer membrane receptor protein involved in Fe transport
MSNLKFARTSMHAALGVALILLFMWALPIQEARAAEVGTIQGVIMDAEGAPLPGATVSIESDNLQGTRKAVTDGQGAYRFVQVPPGRYTIKAEMDGFQTVIQTEIRVSLGTETIIEIELPPSKVSEEVTVVAQAPVIDVTTTQVGTSFESETLERLPTTRSYQDLFNFVPGVQSRTDTQYGGSGDGNPSARGEGQVGNNFLIDGISARDPETNGYGHNINYDAIEEIQILTDGFAAEYGRATGLVANVITKSGGNSLEGSLIATVLIPGKGNPENNVDGSAVGAVEQEYFTPVFNLGGPIVKDKLWYFGSIEYLDQTWSDSSQQENYGYSYDREDENIAPFLKATWSMNENHSINASWIGQRFDRSNRDDFNTNPDSQRSDKRDLDHISATYRGILTPDSFIELKFGSTTVDRQIIPYGDTESAAYFDRGTSRSWGGASTYSYDTTQYDYKLHYTHYLDDMWGDHSLKVGVEYLEADKYEVWLLPGNGYDYTYYEGAPESLDIRFQQAGDPNDNDGTVAFVQDTWDVLENVTLNLGYRYEQMEMRNNLGEAYFDISSHAPRVGAVWDITKDSVNVAKVFWGRFYDFSGLNISWVMNSSSTSSFHNYLWNPDGNGQWTDIDGTTWNGTWDYNFTQGGNEGEPLFPLDGFDSNLKPHHSDKFIIGYERKLTDTQAMGLRYINSKTRDLIEDVVLESGDWLVTNPDLKRRDYDGVELTYHKAMSNNFMLFGSYTWSQSRGTNPGQGEWGDSGGSSDTIGVFLDADPNAPPDDTWYGLGNIYNDAGWYGYLPDDIRHHIKMNGLYRAPWDVDVGLAFEYSSGQAYSRRGYVGGGYNDYMAFPEGRGTYTLPSAYWFDLHLEKTFPFGSRYAVGAFMDVLNLLGDDEIITVWEWDDPDASGGNPFGRPKYRQTPRSWRLGLRFSF